MAPGRSYDLLTMPFTVPSDKLPGCPTMRWRPHASPAGAAAHRLTLLLALGMAPLAASAQAALSEKDYFEALPVVLTVSRLAQPISETPGAVTVIERKTIEALQVRDMAELLRLVPGYFVSGYNGANPIAVYHAPLDEFGIRNLVLIDGRPAYSSYYFGGTSRGLMSVDPQEVERVEVLRGANSAAFGANAMFGVINIVTRHTADTLGGTASLRVGGGGVRDARVSLGRGDQALSYRLSALRRSDDGLRSLFDSRELNQLRLRVDATPGTGEEIQLDAGLSDLRAGDGYAGDVGNPARTLNWRDWHLHGVWRRQLSETEQVKLSLSATRESLRDRYDYLPAPGIVVDFSGVGRRLDAELQHQRSLAPDVRLVWGLGLRQEEAQSRPLFYRDDALSFRESRLFGNLEWRPAPAWTVNGGLFLGHHSWTGAFATPRLMVNHQLSEDHTLRAGINRSVRTPSLFELAADVRYDLNGETLGRTFSATGQVRPERMLSHELGYFGKLPDLRMTLDVRVFRERMDGFIRNADYQLPEPVPYTGTTVSDYVNEPGPRLSGLEYQWRWSPSPHTELWLGQAFTRVQWPDASVGHPPVRSSTLALFHELPNRLKLGLVLAERRPMSWLGVGLMPQALRQADLHLSYPMRVGGNNVRAGLTVRHLNGAKPLFESRFAAPLSRRQAYASLAIEL
jgi:iron complex outermembrane receptor protein